MTTFSDGRTQKASPALQGGRRFSFVYLCVSKGPLFCRLALGVMLGQQGLDLADGVGDGRTPLTRHGSRLRRAFTFYIGAYEFFMTTLSTLSAISSQASAHFSR